MANFDNAHPKLIESTCSFPEFVPASKNKFIPSELPISLFNLFIFEIQSILESHDQTGHIYF